MARSTARAAPFSSRARSRAARAVRATSSASSQLKAQAVIVASGGIGGNADLVRANWPARLGAPPRRMVCGVPAHVDGRMIAIAQRRRRARSSIATACGIMSRASTIGSRSGPRTAFASCPALPRCGSTRRAGACRAPLFPGYDTLGTLEYIMRTGYDYSWFVTNQTIVRKEFSLSGSEQNPDLTGKDWRLVAQRAIGKNATAPVEAFKNHGVDFHREAQPSRPRRRDERAWPAATSSSSRRSQREIEARDREIANPFTKDAQIMGIHNARRYPRRQADPHRAAASHSRSRAWPADRRAPQYPDAQDAGRPRDRSRRARVRRGRRRSSPASMRSGEAAGFGGGGMHGYRSLEGTFLGGCLFSGRTAGRAAAKRRSALERSRAKIVARRRQASSICHIFHGTRKRSPEGSSP